MNDYDPTNATPAESEPATTTTDVRVRPPRARRLLTRRTGGALVAAGLTCAVAGFAGTSAASASPSGTTTSAVLADVTPSPTPTAPEGGAVAGPAAGGATGIVATTSKDSFTFTTAAGVTVTVNESSSTKYTNGSRSATEKVVKKGESVLVLGTVDSATIDATKVNVQPNGDGGVAAAEAAGVIEFQQGTPSPDQSVGEIPEYTEGEGTILSGTVADKAVKAAQEVVPGGVNDRVVELSNGEYEVHNISVNWPHHVFVNEDFEVIGWN
ncbi:hypothetical protein ACFRI7_17710 [Streptomyces sp. NPDC056716]|uniref:hypothetical protein n=1 Tax=unclassified Streptomyces TaxID=2593676 RepID=UPI0036A27DF7